MPNTIGTAYIQIEPTTDGISGKLSQALGGEAESAGKSAGSKLSSALGSAAKIGGVAIAGLTTAIAGSTAATVSAVKGVAEYGDEIDKASQKLGVSSDFYQEWDAVLQHSGTSMSSMTSTFKTLANASQGATADQQAAFEALGLSMEQVASMSTEELFQSVIAGLQGMEEGTERTALATDLLGRGSMELRALLNTSAEDTQGMIDAVNELGGVMSADAVKNSAAFQDSLQNMQTAFGGLKNNLLTEFLPSMTTIMDGLGKLASGDDSGLGLIKQGISEFLDNLSTIIPEMLEIGSSIIEALTQAIMDNLPQIADSAMDIIDKLLDGLIDNLPEIIEMGIELIVKLIVGITEALPKLIEKSPEIIKSIVKGLIAAVPELVSAGRDMVSGIWRGIQSMWSNLTNNVRNLASSLVSSIKSYFRIGSPSKLFRDEIGQWIPAGIAVGIDGNLDPLEKSMSNIQSELSPENINTTSSITANYDASVGSDYATIVGLLNTYLPTIGNQQIVLDSGALVGNTVSQYNSALGRLNTRRT